LEFGIKDGWHEQRSEADGFGIRIRSLVFDRNKQCAGFSVIRMPASLPSSDAQKNGLWLLRSHSDGVVRPQGPPRARSFLRRHAGISGSGGAAGRVPPLWQGEAGTARFLADNPFYTKRFAYYVGQRCRAAPIKDVAKDLALDWHTVKALDKQYMEAPLARRGLPSPQNSDLHVACPIENSAFRIFLGFSCQMCAKHHLLASSATQSATSLWTCGQRKSVAHVPTATTTEENS
jgi:hypothetical protein